jgi:hypothetical protein
VGAEKDHIVPWRSAWRIAQLTSAQTHFVLAASGHIAGMINPPSKGKGGIGRTTSSQRRRTPTPGWPARKSMTAAGGPIWPVGSGPGPWREYPRRPSEVLPIPRSATRREPTSWKNRRIGALKCNS